jgi:hypothetical protein
MCPKLKRFCINIQQFLSYANFYFSHCKAICLYHFTYHFISRSTLETIFPHAAILTFSVRYQILMISLLTYTFLSHIPQFNFDLSKYTNQLFPTAKGQIINAFIKYSTLLLFPSYYV